MNERYLIETKVNNLISELNNYSQCDDEYNSILKELAMLICKTHAESLFQLIKHASVYDGDIISKSLRDNLIHWKFASKGYYKGEAGYTYGNYRGGNLLKYIQEITCKWSLNK